MCEGNSTNEIQAYFFPPSLPFLLSSFNCSFRFIHNNCLINMALATSKIGKQGVCHLLLPEKEDRCQNLPSRQARPFTLNVLTHSSLPCFPECLYQALCPGSLTKSLSLHDFNHSKLLPKFGPFLSCPQAK